MARGRDTRTLLTRIVREKSVREQNRRRQEGAKRTTESSTLDSQHPVRLIDRARWTTTLPGGRAADGEGERWKLLPRKGTWEGVYDRREGKIFPSLFSPFAVSLFLSLSLSHFRLFSLPCIFQHFSLCFYPPVLFNDIYSIPPLFFLSLSLILLCLYCLYAALCFSYRTGSEKEGEGLLLRWVKEVILKGERDVKRYAEVRGRKRMLMGLQRECNKDRNCAEE